MSKYFDWKTRIQKQELNECINILRNDGVIVFPTETVYGIGANAQSNIAVEKIFDIKQRPKQKAINIMVSDINEISKYAIIKNELEKKIIQKFMPGPITIILEKKDNIPDIVTAKNKKIGIRIPNNSIALKILKTSKIPLAVPSANISGKQSGTSINAIKQDFDGKVDVFIDGGNSKIGEPSTIVEIVNSEIIIHREGKISKEEIIREIRS